MKVLLAEDDAVTRIAVEAALVEWGFEVSGCPDGQTAWERLERPDGPRLALLDWLMPGLDGPEVCRRVRAKPGLESAYLILLTARDSRADIIAGLAAGADDYVAKPFDREELRLRLRSGHRILQLQANLAIRVNELEDAMVRVKQLQGIVPICSYCKKVRTDRDYWEQVEGYLATQIDMRFSHGICPDCYETRVKPELARMKKQPGGTAGEQKGSTEEQGRKGAGEPGNKP
jgi:sigma-B regulation protein RsbU (phosphoserine phosphatase)